MYAYVHAHKSHSCTRAHTFTNKHTHTHTHAHIHTHTRAHTHTRTCPHARTHINPSSPTLTSGHSYELHFTGTTPQHLRLHLLNSISSQAIVLAVFYSQSWRLDIHVNDVYILPTNGARDASNRVVLTAPTSPGQYVPDVTTAQTGVNYFDRATGLLHIAVRGPTPVDIITTPLIVVSFSMPAMTEDEFFGENIVANLALFLNVPANKIRIASSVRQTNRRRRRQAGSVLLSLEIGNAPGASASAPAASDLSLERLQTMSAQIVSAYQMQTLGGVLNATLLGMDIVQPPPAPGSEAWVVMAAPGSTATAASSPAIIGSLYVSTQPAQAVEAETFGVQPIVGFLDTEVRAFICLHYWVNPQLLFSPLLST